MIICPAVAQLAKTTSFGYDAADNLAGWSDGTTSATHSYDDAVRLTSVTSNVSARNESFQLDAAGNRTQDSRSGTDAWTYDDANQLTSRGPISYRYDDAGNLIQKTDTRLSEPQKTTHYVWDAFNRLSEVRDGADSLIATYAYDPLNRRIRKATPANTTYYLQGDQACWPRPMSKATSPPATAGAPSANTAPPRSTSASPARTPARTATCTTRTTSSARRSG